MGTYIGRREWDKTSKVLRLQIYEAKALEDTSSLSSISIEKPNNVPSQSWKYRLAKEGEKFGDTLITENVTLVQV